MKSLVSFLNTLHRIDGNNINTTAESFKNYDNYDILHRDQDFIECIEKALANNGKVLLTGFAGDGKTTIAKFIADDLTLETFDFNSDILELKTKIGNLTIIKDLSEIPHENAAEKLYEKVTSNTESVLIVSNTGTIRSRLLEAYKDNMFLDKFTSESEFETAILDAIESGDGKKIEKLDVHVFNLVKRDNLLIAKSVFKKILDLSNWNNANDIEKKSTVYLNVQLLKANNSLALERIFFIYRRIYEYGIRLTMRNLLEHFAYTITGNLNNIVEDNSQRLFVDNFFGAFNEKALDLVGVKAVRKFNFGSNIPSMWKRRIFNGINVDESLVISLPLEVNSIKRYKDLNNENGYLECPYSVNEHIEILRRYTINRPP